MTPDSDISATDRLCWHCRQAIRHDDDDAREVRVEGRDEWMCGKCLDDLPTLDYMTTVTDRRR